MSQLDRIQRLIAKISYKKGWAIQAREDYLNRMPHYEANVILAVSCMQPDTITGHETPICVQRSIHLHDLERMKDEDILTYYISGTIRELELHEMDEWLKFDGAHVRDPHP